MRTIKEAKSNDAVFRLVKTSNSIVGIAILNGEIQARIEGDDADDVWRRLHDRVATASPKFFGFDGARNRFLRIFPSGFSSQRYAEHERIYKLDAKRRLDEAIPLEAALSGSGHGEAVLAIFRATNLLSPFESMRIQGALRSPQADDFIRGAARFTLGEMESGLAQMAQALKAHEVAKWTAVTYLPYLWRPQEHMFLKPAITCEFAERVGHRFANRYNPRLDLPVYESLLDLTRTTMHEIIDLEPSDHIDIQSFIWVVGYYGKEAGGPRSSEAIAHHRLPAVRLKHRADPDFAALIRATARSQRLGPGVVTAPPWKGGTTVSARGLPRRAVSTNRSP